MFKVYSQPDHIHSATAACIRPPLPPPNKGKVNSVCHTISCRVACRMARSGIACPAVPLTFLFHPPCVSASRASKLDPISNFRIALIARDRVRWLRSSFPMYLPNCFIFSRTYQGWPTWCNWRPATGSAAPPPHWP